MESLLDASPVMPRGAHFQICEIANGVLYLSEMNCNAPLVAWGDDTLLPPGTDQGVTTVLDLWRKREKCPTAPFFPQG